MKTTGQEFRDANSGVLHRRQAFTHRPPSDKFGFQLGGCSTDSNLCHLVGQAAIVRTCRAALLPIGCSHAPLFLLPTPDSDSLPDFLLGAARLNSK